MRRAKHCRHVKEDGIAVRLARAPRRELLPLPSALQGTPTAHLAEPGGDSRSAICTCRRRMISMRSSSA